VDVRVLGGAQLTALAAACRAAGKDVEKELVDGLDRAVKPLEPAIQANIGPTMPAGYEETLSRSLRIRIARRASGLRITAEAKGRKGLRDLPRMDRGALRHPVYGRMHRRVWSKTKPRQRIPGGQLVANPWVSQRIKPGVVTEPFERLEPKMLDEIGKAMDRIAQKVAG
jgi:hypothetical protein